MNLDQKALQRLNDIGIALSKEHRLHALLEMILLNAKTLTAADGGTIYLVTAENTLRFEVALSTSLGFHAGGTTAIPIPFKELPLFLPDGSPNDNLMVTYAVNHKTTVNVKDAYHEQGFDFSGTRAFDETTGYRTRAVLTIPIKNHEEDVVGVLQLINPPDERSFSDAEAHLAESLASQAGVALTNQLLIHNLRKLFESLIRVIAEAVDEKSPSTGNHSKRVPVIAGLLAQAVSDTTEGPLQEVHFSPQELYELKVASFLHDCGKITTPVHIMEKHTKLETIYDRIELVQARYQALLEKIEKETLLQKLNWFELHYPREFGSAQEAFIRMDSECHDKVIKLEEEKEWLKKVNESRAPVSDETIDRLNQIARTSGSSGQPLLTLDELENLSIRKGNITQRERGILEHHVVMTYRMLSQLDFPKELRKVPQIASSHHERADGKGYPLGLKKDEILLQARILIVADIFEALSAPDRPYKAALPLSKVLTIMGEMVKEGHLDADVYEVFLKKKVYLPYARQYLSPEQIDTE